jgi:NitT/TauT family transport system substrate-binding protein
MNRRSLIFGAAATMALAACGDSAASKGKTKVNFGYIGDYNGTSLIATANDQKLWAKHDLEVSTKVFTTGPLQVTALGAGDLDFGYIGPGAIWLPASGKTKIVAMNSLGNADRLVSQAGITTVEGLKGKKVGVPAGTSGDMILTLALEKAGMTMKDIQRVEMDAPTIVSAFGSGAIDGAGIWYPLLNTIKTKKPGLVELAKDSDFSDKFSFPTAFIAADGVVTGKKDMLTKVIQVLREAMDYRAANSDAVIALVAKMINQPVDTVKADAANSQMLSSADADKYTTDGTFDKWLTGIGDFFVGAGKLTSDPDPKTYYLGDTFTGAATK